MGIKRYSSTFKTKPVYCIDCDQVVDKVAEPHFIAFATEKTALELHQAKHHPGIRYANMVMDVLAAATSPERIAR